MSGLLCATYNDIVVVVQGDMPSSPAEFDALLLEWESGFKKTNYNLRSVIVADSGPDAIQRKRCSEIGWGRGASRALVVTDKTAVRGIVTALSWVGVPLRAAAPGKHQGELRNYLNFTKDELMRLHETATALRRRLTVPATSVDRFLEASAVARV